MPPIDNLLYQIDVLGTAVTALHEENERLRADNQQLRDEAAAVETAAGKVQAMVAAISSPQEVAP